MKRTVSACSSLECSIDKEGPSSSTGKCFTVQFFVPLLHCNVGTEWISV